MGFERKNHLQTPSTASELEGISKLHVGNIDMVSHYTSPENVILSTNMPCVSVLRSKKPNPL